MQTVMGRIEQFTIAVLRAIGIEKQVRAVLNSMRLRIYGNDLTMPRYFYHSPMDYGIESHPPRFGDPVIRAGEPFPIPPADCRPGYSPDDDDHYLEWGRSDHDEIIRLIEKHRGINRDMMELMPPYIKEKML